MAIKSADQISIIDITDAYSVILTNDSYTFPGTTAAAKAGSCTTQIVAMRGAEQIPASVILTDITKPTGITVTKDGDATSPTLTITASTSFTTAGVVKIPVLLEDGTITINKDFSVAIAFTGATGATGAGGIWYTGTSITGTSTTATIFSGSGVSSAKVGDMYLNTSTWNTYRCTVAGAASAAKWVYACNVRGGTGATGAAGGSIWSTTTAPATSGTTYTFTNTNLTGATGTPKVGDTILYSYYYYTVTSVTSTTAVCANTRVSIRGATGATGAAGADAITMSITSSAGTIFKNSAVVTTLTAHVYKAGVEVTGTDLTALGTIKWYKDGSNTALSTTGPTLTISAGDVTSKATYVAQLEG